MAKTKKDAPAGMEVEWDDAARAWGLIKDKGRGATVTVTREEWSALATLALGAAMGTAPPP